eukprot:8266802-Pyramimonas_sp.AAC.1
MATWSTDVPVELISSDEGDDLFLTLPTTTPDTHAHIYSIVATPYAMVTIIAWICWSFVEVRVVFQSLPSQWGLSSGGNLDKTTCVDLGDPSVQRAVDHYFA